MSGVLYAPLVQYIDPAPFSLGFSLSLLLMVIVGGAGTFWGPFVGSAVAVLAPEPELLRGTGTYYLVIYAALVLALMVFCPAACSPCRRAS